MSDPSGRSYRYEKWISLCLFGGTLLFPNVASAKLCNPAKEACWLSKGRGSASSPAYPSNNTSIQINPAAVPVEKGFGVETIVFDGEWDLSLVKGLGRVGAAISPTNNEESFFGPPSFEPSPEYLQRKIDKEKYNSQKVVLAGAFNVWTNKKNGMKQLRMNLGLMGKYNVISDKVLPGGGLSLIMGPLTIGYSYGRDQYVVEAEEYGLPEDIDYRYNVGTFSFGVFLNSLALDYSIQKLKMENQGEYFEEDAADIRILTASLLLKRWILTLADRREDSSRPAYDSGSKTLVAENIKKSIFGGVQFGVTKTIMVGVFYNYYLLDEVSLGATIFL